MELICMGDSLTFGFGTARPHRWTTLAANETGIHIVNRGMNGDTAMGIALRLRTQVLNAPEFTSFRTDCPGIMIMGGSNDIFYSGSDICARDSIGTMIHQCAGAGLTPLIGIPLPLGTEGYPEEWSNAVDFRKAAEMIDGYCMWLRSYCKAFGVPYVDFHAAFLDGSRVRDELYMDGMHPNLQGNRVMADTLIPVLKELYHI